MLPTKDKFNFLIHYAMALKFFKYYKYIFETHSEDFIQFLTIC